MGQDPELGFPLGSRARAMGNPQEEIHLPAMSPFLPHGHQRLFMGWPWETEGKVHEAGRSPTVGSRARGPKENPRLVASTKGGTMSFLDDSSMTSRSRP